MHNAIVYYKPFLGYQYLPNQCGRLANWLPHTLARQGTLIQTSIPLTWSDLYFNRTPRLDLSVVQHSAHLQNNSLFLHIIRHSFSLVAFWTCHASHPCIWILWIPCGSRTLPWPTEEMLQSHLRNCATCRLPEVCEIVIVGIYSQIRMFPETKIFRLHLWYSEALRCS
jgi:hypothetical protein